MYQAKFNEKLMSKLQFINKDIEKDAGEGGRKSPERKSDKL